MATVAARLITIVSDELVKTAKDKVTNAVKDYFSEKVSSLIGSPDSKADALQDVLKELNQLHQEVEQLNVQMAKDLQGIALTLVQSKDTSITYDEVKEKLQSLGTKATNTVEINIRGIHEALVGGLEGSDAATLLPLATSNAIKNSRDFMHYCCSMRTFLLRFWQVEAKGLTLLAIAQNTDGVNHVGIDSEMIRIQGWLKKQEDSFRQAVPQYALAEAILNNKISRTTVDFRLGFTEDQRNLFWIEGSKDEGGPSTGVVAFTAKPQKVMMEPRDDLGNIDPNKDYTFRIILGGDSNSGDGIYVATDIGYGNLDLSEWRIIPVGTGKFSGEYCIQFVSNLAGKAGDNAWLVANQDASGFLLSYNFSDDRSDSNRGHFFKIQPWTGEPDVSKV